MGMAQQSTPAVIKENSKDVLEDDVITVPGQLYACVSFVSPISRQKSPQCAMKIRGVFATEDEAGAHAKRIQKYETVSVDIFVCPLYKWLVIPPDTDQIQDQHYQEEFLENLMTNYRDSQEKAKQHFYERKKKVVEEGLDPHLEESEIIPQENDTDKYKEFKELRENLQNGKVRDPGQGRPYPH